MHWIRLFWLEVFVLPVIFLVVLYALPATSPYRILNLVLYSAVLVAAVVGYVAVLAKKQRSKPTSSSTD